MRLTKIAQIEDFLAAVNKAKGEVYLTSPEGDKLNLKSTLTQYVAVAKLLGDRGDELELWCDSPADESLFYAFYKKHPEVTL